MFRAGAISTAGDLSGVRLEREIPSRTAYAYVDARCIREKGRWALYRLFHACYAYRTCVADELDGLSTIQSAAYPS